MAEKNNREGSSILGDFSVSQLVATGLAAATSFALSAQIGITGSIIGAVLGAVASSVATQVYRNILSASAEKLRALGSEQDEQANTDTETAAPSASVTEALSPAQVTTEIPARPGSISGRAHVEEVAETGTPIAPREVRDAAHERRQALIRRRVAVVAAAAGIVVVLAFALAVSLATHGEGIGPTPVAPSEPAVEQPSDVASESEGDAGAQTGATEQPDDGTEPSEDSASNSSTTDPDTSVSSPTTDADGSQSTTDTGTSKPTVDGSASGDTSSQDGATGEGTDSASSAATPGATS